MSAPRVVFRVAKLKTWGQVSAAAAHNLRARPTPNAGPGGVVEVVQLRADSAITAVRDRIGEQTIRKNAVLVVEAIVSASPEYFRPDDPSHAGHCDPDRLAAWRAAVEPWIAEAFPHAVSVVLHLDEATPHYQILDVPLDERGKLNARSKYGGAATLARWQDRAAAPVARLGIERGLAGSLAKHERIKTFYGAANVPAPAVPKVSTPTPEPLEPRSAAERVPFTDAKAARDAAEAAHAEQEAKRTREIRAQQTAKLKAWPQLAQKANAADLADRRRRDAEATAAKKDAEAAALREQADRLRALPLADVLRRVYSAERERGSRETHRTRKYKLPDGREIAVSAADRGGEVWIEQGAQKGQRGAINLVMQLDGLDYRGAVRMLAEHFEAPALAAEHARALVGRAARDVAQAIQDPAPVPAPSPERWPAARAWRPHARARPGRLVAGVHQVGGGDADARGNAVFPRAAGGAFVRGTGPERFHRTIGRKDAGPYVIDGPGAVWLCEAPIDAASIKAHEPAAHVLALGGAMLTPADVRELVPQGRGVVLAFDADEQGRAFERAALTIWPRASKRPPPVGKDWNEALARRPALASPAWTEGGSSSGSANEPPRPGNGPSRITRGPGLGR